MIVNQTTKTIQLKIVYFGPAMSGKTTSLRKVMAKFGKEEELRSIETSTGRTLVFDFGSIIFTGKEWNLKILLLSTTGQDFYASTRPATIEMMDGFVFVADSQRKYIDDNIRSWKELFLYFGEKIYDLPAIICLNKQDLMDLIPEDIIVERFKLNLFKKCTILKTVATDGIGVINSIKKLLEYIFPSIAISA